MVKGHFELPKDLKPIFKTTEESVAIESGMAIVYKELKLKMDTEFGTKGSNSSVVKYGKWIGNPALVFYDFKVEKDALEYFRNPNIIELKHAEFNGEMPWLVLEDGGQSLYNFIKNELSVDLETRLDIVDGVLQGLAKIHRGGWLHGDVKPENILVTRKLIDFGHSVFPNSSDYKGTTFEYAPPEGENISPWADIFQVGLVLACIIKKTMGLGILGTTKSNKKNSRMCYSYDSNGKLITIQPSSSEFLNRITVYHSEGYRFHTNYPEIDQIIARATRKNPVERYKNADEMREELQVFRRKLKEGTTEVGKQSEASIEGAMFQRVRSFS